MDEANSKEGKVISELITHVNTLEQKISTLQETISEANDLQMVNKLDIVNLRNELEKLTLSIPNMSPEQSQQLQELAALTEDKSIKELLSMGKQVEELVKAVDELGARVAEAESHPTEAMIQDIEGMKTKIRSPGDGNLEPLIKKNYEQGKALEARVKALESGSPSGLSKLETRITRLELKKQPDIKEELKELKKLTHQSHTHPSKTSEDSKQLHTRLTHLEQQVKNLQGNVHTRGKPAPSSGKDIRILQASMKTLRKEIEKDIQREVKRGNKETIAYILKQLKRMVNG